MRYVGIRYSGNPIGGQMSPAVDVAGWVELCFEHGWRRLRVVRGNVTIGGIDVHPITGQRIWWADDLDAQRGDDHAGEQMLTPSRGEPASRCQIEAAELAPAHSTLLASKIIRREGRSGDPRSSAERG